MSEGGLKASDKQVEPKYCVVVNRGRVQTPFKAWEVAIINDQHLLLIINIPAQCQHAKAFLKQPLAFGEHVVLTMCVAISEYEPTGNL